MGGKGFARVGVAGLALKIAGVVVVARGEQGPDDANPIDEQMQPAKKGLGVNWAIFSAACFGVMFWLLGLRVVPLLGGAPSVWIIRLTSAVTTALVMLAARQSMAPPPRQDAPWILGDGFLDTSAYVFNNYSMLHEQTSVVIVLASLYGAVTVALAAPVLRDKGSPSRGLGFTTDLHGSL